MATFTKLLVINMVANNRFGRSSKFLRVTNFLSLLPSKASTSAGPKEKQATSEPDISAEQIKSIRTSKLDTIRLRESPNELKTKKVDAKTC